MVDRAKVRERIWLFLGAAASLCSTLLGCAGALGASWMQYSALQTFPFILLLLEVPAFVLVMLSRRFILGLWIIAVAYPVTLFLVDREIYTEPSGLVLYGGLGTVGPILTAVFSHFNFRTRRFADSKEAAEEND